MRKSTKSAAVFLTLLCLSNIGATHARPFKIEIWADNWFSAYLDGKPLVEDSVAITTERSFNAETHRFSAEYPIQLAFKIKDFKENDTGLEYIGSRRQQMGDGGFIMQLTDQISGRVVGVSDSTMRCMVIHKAPVSSACAKEHNPVAGVGNCQFVALEAPAGWQDTDYDDSSWENAHEYSAATVRPKGGYDRIYWDNNAKLIWGSDLEKDNTVLCRITVSD
ncbi:MAG: PEBP family protein [Gammaproteobacteria bacterium]|nr:PEBP family protein [Gammaproteobacteria bacterium]